MISSLLDIWSTGRSVPWFCLIWSIHSVLKCFVVSQPYSASFSCNPKLATFLFFANSRSFSNRISFLVSSLHSLSDAAPFKLSLNNFSDDSLEKVDSWARVAAAGEHIPSGEESSKSNGWSTLRSFGFGLFEVGLTRGTKV